MKTLILRSLTTLIALVLLASTATAQTALTTTTLTNAVVSTTTPGNLQITVGSNTGAVANSTAIYWDGEFSPVTAVSGTTLITVQRGAGGTQPRLHPASSLIWIGSILGGTSGFTTVDPQGSCTASATFVPTINIATNRFYSCANAMWQGWGQANVSQSRARVSLTGLTVSGGGQLPYPMLPTDDIVVLSTTSQGCGCVAGSSSVNKSIILPSHLGLAGKQITIMDESGGISATTSIVLVGTINGTHSGAANVVQLKTAFSSVTLHAGSGGWFLDVCTQTQATGVTSALQCR